MNKCIYNEVKVNLLHARIDLYTQRNMNLYFIEHTDRYPLGAQFNMKMLSLINRKKYAALEFPS